MPTPRRRANSRASSADTPRGGPPAGSGWASTELPKLIAARRRPVGASSATRSGVIVSVMLGFASSYPGTQSERPGRSLLVGSDGVRLEQIPVKLSPGLSGQRNPGDGAAVLIGRSRIFAAFIIGPARWQALTGPVAQAGLCGAGGYACANPPCTPNHAAMIGSGSNSPRRTPAASR